MWDVRNHFEALDQILYPYFLGFGPITYSFGGNNFSHELQAFAGVTQISIVQL